MKNIYLLIFILIFLYIICNGYIENFSVGGQSPINISGSLTLSHLQECEPGQRQDGKYDCNDGKCIFAYTNDKINYRGNYKDLEECKEYCK